MRDVFQREGFHLLDELTNLADNAFIKRPAEQDPIQPESAYLMMIVEYPQKKLLNDLVLLGQTLERSRDSEGLHSLSLCYFEWLRNYSEAHKYCEKAIKLNADFAEAWNTLGIISFELRQYKDAICAYQKATSITKSYRTAWYNLGNVYAHIGRHEEAASAYKQALEVDNNYYPAWVNLGNIHYLSGRPQEAQQAYKQAIDIDYNIYEAWSGLGLTTRQLAQSEKDNEAAITAYQRALEIDANAHEVWNNLSFLYYDLKRYEEALETSRNAQRLSPQKPLYWAILGLTLSHLGPKQKEESFYWLCQAWKMQGALEVSADDVKEAIIRIGYGPDDCN
jgi:tetratricopeptide (TPR) repeat protein